MEMVWLKVDNERAVGAVYPAPYFFCQSSDVVGRAVKRIARQVQQDGRIWLVIPNVNQIFERYVGEPHGSCAHYHIAKERTQRIAGMIRRVVAVLLRGQQCRTFVVRIYLPLAAKKRCFTQTDRIANGKMGHANAALLVERRG
jgi:hypothetical protein